MTAVQEARELLDRLSRRATWDDIMYEFFVRKKLATSLKAASEGRVVPHGEVKKRLLGR